MELKDTVIGLELGSTRIKAVLVDRQHNVLAQGSYGWENSFINNVWTYSMDEVRTGLEACFASLKKDVKEKYGIALTTAASMGISGMMHGYLAFDENWDQICEFRTWRNTMTGPAAAKLSEAFGFNMPQRWSGCHVFQAMLNREEHLSRLDHITTLAGYVHYLLTGEYVMGVGEASGMFPIDSSICDYNKEMAAKFDRMVEELGYSFKHSDLFPKVLAAGDEAGCLTREGALLLDPSGEFQAGIPLCPPEGDAGTGMVATNSVKVGTGNVSAGTSDFAMVVVDKVPGTHREIDMVTTPSGSPVAMVHCNNCTCDIDAWAGIIRETLNSFGVKADAGEVFTKLYTMALEGEPDAGGIVSYNYYSGEGVTDLDEGRVVLLRKADSNFTLANLMRNNLMSAMSTLKIGMDILTQEEHVRIDKLYGHGGFFKTPVAGQTILSAAVGAPVSVMTTAGEGGPYGMALLAAYAAWHDENETLEDYLENKVYAGCESVTLMATEEDMEGYRKYLDTYKKAFAVEKTAIETY